MAHMDYMAEAISLAHLAAGNVSPNPAVGAVIVRDGEIVGRGYTQPPGGDHAEIMALKQAGERAHGATLYVTLEPCCHYGRTPPCTRALIQAGIKEVHFALIDPNPRVNGKGRNELERHGIRTFIGEKAEEAQEINEAYLKYITTGLPFVTVKYAMSLDGKIATRTGDSRWISGEKAREYVHLIRYISDAILVGVNTVIKDDPLLTARPAGKNGIGKQPLRIILDTNGRTPVDARVFQQPGRTLIVHGHISEDTRSRFARTPAELLQVPTVNNLLDLEALLKLLGQREIMSILVEGGSTVLGSFFDRRLVDKVLVFVSPLIIGGATAFSPVAGQGVGEIAGALRLQKTKIKEFDHDIMISGYLSEV